MTSKEMASIETTKIGIVVLNYNSAPDTLALIARLRQFNRADLELIVVDNRSTDDSAQLLETQLPSAVHLIKSAINGGYAAGNNQGIKLAMQLGCELAMIINSDIEPTEDFITPLKAFMVATPMAAIASPVLVGDNNFHDYGRSVFLGRLKSAKLVKPNQLEHPIQVDAVTGACYMIKVAAIREVGLIPEPYFLNYEETEWCLRFRQAGYTINSLPSISVFHREHGSIGKVSGLQLYYMKRNVVLFNRRMGTRRQQFALLLQLVPLSLVQSLKHRSLVPIQGYYDGWRGIDRRHPQPSK